MSPIGFLARKISKYQSLVAFTTRNTDKPVKQSDIQKCKGESSKAQTDREKTRSISSSEDEDEDSTRESNESRNLSETFVVVIAHGAYLQNG